MAQGAYLAPGSVKELKSCYVGAGGVKEVTQIYAGAGGVKFVWPPYIYSNGKFGTLCGGSATALNPSNNYAEATFESDCIRLRSRGASNSTVRVGVVFGSTLATGSYSSLSMGFNLNTVPTSTNYDVRLGFCLYSTKPTSSSDVDTSSYIAYSTVYTLNNQSSGAHTLTLDMSSISGSYYVGFYVYTNYLNSNNAFSLDVTEVYVR